MRFVEAGYDGFVERHDASRRACGVYGAVILAFVGGALAGAFASRAWGAHAIWAAAAALASTLALFIVDERVSGNRTRPGPVTCHVTQAVNGRGHMRRIGSKSAGW